MSLESRYPRSPTHVGVSTSSETLPPKSQDDFPVGSEDALLIPVESDMYDQEHTLTVSVDPSHEVSETDEDDNGLNIKIYLRSNPREPSNARRFRRTRCTQDDRRRRFED